MRSKNSFLTVITSLIPIFIVGILGFIKTRLFIESLGSEANGLIQMVYRILGYLSLAELGLGGAIMYKLYKPIKDDDKEKISIIITTATYYFRRIGLAILIFLFIGMFFIPLLIHNNTYENIYIYVVFIIAGLPYAFEYIFYKQYYILIAADQKQYINNIIFNGSNIVYNLILIIALLKNINIFEYILISYPFVLLKAICLKKYVKKHYGYIKRTSKIDKETINMSKDVFVHNIGDAINNSCDQLILSIFNGLTYVSIYTSYLYIVKYLKDITGAILKSTLYSFGNLFASKDNNNGKSYRIFKEFLSFSCFLSILITVTFYYSIKSFIMVWIDNPEYIIDILGILSFTFLINTNIIIIPLNIVATANGLFKYTKYYSFINTFANVILSIILMRKFEIGGIVSATILSTLLIWFPLVLKVVYKNLFYEHSKLDYIKQIIKSLLLSSMFIIIINLLNLQKYYSNNILNWLMISTLCFLLTFLLTSIIYILTDKYFRNFIIRIIELFWKGGKNENINCGS